MKSLLYGTSILVIFIAKHIFDGYLYSVLVINFTVKVFAGRMLIVFFVGRMLIVFFVFGVFRCLLRA